MRGNRLVTRGNLLLSLTALLLLIVVAWCLAASPAGALISETTSPATVLDLFFAADEGQLSPEGSAPELADLEAPTAGAASFGDSPLFSWNPGGGTYSMDWGDMDRDGDLDLVTGSAGGVTVYLNDQGQLIQLWTMPGPALGVRWFDRAGSATVDPNLEVVVVGESTDGQPSSPGTMDLYLETETATPSVETYSVPAQLLRVEPRDFDGDVGIDLVVSTNALDPPTGCPVLLYRRQSVGRPYDSQPECVSDEATASLAAADADGDGDPDLALALHMSKELRVAINTGGVLTVANSVLVDGPLPHIPYDLAWGDFDRDGLLDLAAAFPLERQVRIYRAASATPDYTWAYTLTTTSLLTPLALDWADVDGDGRLELIVGDLPPTVYAYDPGTGSFSVAASLSISGGRLQEIRAIDADNDTDLDLSLADEYGPSQLYENRAPILGRRLDSLSGGAAGVAWGDYTRDGLLDLALATSGGVRLYASLGAGFDTPVDLNTGPAGDLAWAAYNTVDPALDLAVAGSNGVKVYLNEGGSLASNPSWSDLSDPAETVAWADWNSDGRLDLAVGGPFGVRLYGHDGSELSASPVFSAGSLDAWDLGWADYDGDFYPDLAVASTQGVQVYHNEVGVLTPLWPLPVGGNARSVTWADYDGDGWPELATGLYGPANLIYDNQDGVLSTAPTFIGGSGATGNTTQLAWGDPDGDGDLDLAVAQEDGPDLIYANVGGQLLLDLAAGLGWSSPGISPTTGLAWGDLAGDGDLDLAVTAADGSGWYANNRSLPSHLGSEYTPLAQNPSVLPVPRPGAIDDAYFFSAGEVLGTPAVGGMVPFEFSYYDPEGDQWAGISFQFSLDGGGTWQTTQNVGLATVGGGIFSGQWNAAEDDAVSDDARLRLVAIDGPRSGPVQSVWRATTSPPFRVRGTDCIWPSGPAIDVLDPLGRDPVVGELVSFLGSVEEGSGQLTFSWDFDDGITKTGQQVTHRFQDARDYDVKLTVEATPVGGEFCPTRPVMTHRVITVVVAADLGRPWEVGDQFYLPLVLRGVTRTAYPDLSETER